MVNIDKLTNLIKASGKSRTYLASKINKKQWFFTDVQRGKYGINNDDLAIIADELGTTPEYLRDETDTPFRTPKPTTPGSRWIPVLGNVRAGLPTEAIQDFDADDLDNWEEIPESMARNGDYFCLRIRGDSMNPVLSEDDIVVVRKQEDAESGDIVVALVNGEDATVKKLKKRPDGIELIPFNPLYDIMFFSNAQIESLPVAVIGRVVESRRKF